MGRLALLLALLAAVAVAIGARDTGPSAQVSPRPSTLALGRAWSPTIVLRGTSGRPRLELRGAGRRTVTARRVGPSRWRARVVFPASGRWTWTVRVGGRALARGALTVTAPPPRLRLAFGMAMRDGELLIADSEAHRVYRASLATGRLTPFAGTGRLGTSGDGGPALVATLGVPTGIAVGPDGSVYLSDIETDRVRRIDAGGRVSTVGRMEAPADVAVNAAGDVYVSTLANYLFRIAGGSGPLERVAGDGSAQDSGDGGPAAAAQVNGPHGVEIDPSGNVVITTLGRIRRIDARSGRIETIAGDGVEGHAGDGGPARDARIDAVKLVFAADGTLFLIGGGYPNGSRVRRIAPDGAITTAAGNGRIGPEGDGGPAIEAGFRGADLQLAPDGSLLVLTAEYPWAGVRRVDLRSGLITTVVPGRLPRGILDGCARSRSPRSSPPR